MPKNKIVSESLRAGLARQRCGIVMPISVLDGCSEDHWAEVRAIVEDAIDSVEMEPHLVAFARVGV